jgi:hypothetical protein
MLNTVESTRPLLNLAGRDIALIELYQLPESRPEIASHPHPHTLAYRTQIWVLHESQVTSLFQMLSLMKVNQ